MLCIRVIKVSYPNVCMYYEILRLHQRGWASKVRVRLRCSRIQRLDKSEHDDQDANDEGGQ